VALPTSYLTSAKNLEAIVDAIRNAKAPERFTSRFLEIELAGINWEVYMPWEGVDPAKLETDLSALLA
jgi:hypothetical protein